MSRMGKSLGDIYTQGGFSGKSAGSMSLDYLDTIFQQETGDPTWSASGGTWNMEGEYGNRTNVFTEEADTGQYFEGGSEGWDYYDKTDSGELFWEYDSIKEKNIEKMYDRKMDSLSSTIDKMFRTTKENLNKTSINIGKTNLMSGRHLDERKAISEEAGIKLTKTKSDISIDAIKTDMKVQNLRKKYESDILDVSDELDIDRTSLDDFPNVIDSSDVNKYNLNSAGQNVGETIVINGVKYTWKNYKTVFKSSAMSFSNVTGKVRRFGWVSENASSSEDQSGSDGWDTF